MKKIVYLLIIFFSISSCRTQKDVLYFKNIDEVIHDSQTNYTDPAIQTGDALQIIVSAFNAELAAPFNLQLPTSQRAAQGQGASNPTAYIVSSEGTIDLPMLGTVQVTGKTRQELSTFLEEKIAKYIDNPIVNVRYLNFRVTMLGEFNRPGVVNSDIEKLTITEAIANAGDLSLYAIRDSILLIRTVDGIRNKMFVNLQDANSINSEAFYLRQNDIIYAMPNKLKAFDINTKPLTAVLTGLGLITAILTLFR